MKKLSAVHPDDLRKVMDELTEELRPVLWSSQDAKEKEAEEVFLGTLYRLTLSLFDWLPAEQRSEIVTACGTWFDVGLLMGRSPMTLVDILERVNPRLVDTEIPDWVSRTPPPE
ncbi:hypothetical protein ES703_112068 [subsurface metagenome]